MLKTVFAIACAAALGLAAPALAQLPPGVYPGEPSLAKTTVGHYDLDASHTAVLAKVSHIGYSLSVFRFDKTEGALTWDPARPEASALNVSVDTASIATPVPGFAAELSGANFLKSAQFPKASFTSTAFHRIDDTHGRVDGQFTLMGQTRPVSFGVELLGAGRGFGDHPRIGVVAHTRINPADYGLPAMFGPSILIEVDAEFAHS